MRKPAGFAAHRCYIAEVDSQGLVADCCGTGVFREVNSRDEGVGRYQQLLPCLPFEYRRVVADTEHHICRWYLDVKKPFYEGKFIQWKEN